MGASAWDYRIIVCDYRDGTAYSLLCEGTAEAVMFTADFTRCGFSWWAFRADASIAAYNEAGCWACRFEGDCDSPVDRLADGAGAWGRAERFFREVLNLQ